MVKYKEYACVDIMKFVFCICIVFMHTNVISGFPDFPQYFIGSILLNSAVPYFFIVTGYFLATSVKKRGSGAVKEYVHRLKAPLIIFSSINLIFRIIDMRISGATILSTIRDSVQRMLFYQPGSMWFVAACIIGAMILLPFFIESQSYISKFIVIVLMCAGFAFLLLTTTYYWCAEKIGLSTVINRYLNIFVSARNGLFFGGPFMGIGVVIERKELLSKFEKYKHSLIVITVIAFLLLSIEVILNYGMPCGEGQSVFILQLFAIPALFMMTANIDLKNSGNTRWIRKLSTGIYFIHQIVLWTTKKLCILCGLPVIPFVHFLLVIGIATFICLWAYRKNNVMARLLK